VYIDIEFEDFVKLKVGKAEYGKINERHRKRMMHNFDVQVKRSFSGQDDKKRSVELRDVEENVKEGIIDESVTLST
jgi:hypothetical protein